jgi:hypothetical protein
LMVHQPYDYEREGDLAPAHASPPEAAGLTGELPLIAPAARNPGRVAAAPLIRDKPSV